MSHLCTSTRPASRLTSLSPTIHTPKHTQVRHATLIKRPRRPYTFTQLVTLSDGSAYLHRTTSPAPIYRSQKDTRNSPLWNPSSQKLMNVEADEAGRLRAFRARFGRGWDARSAAEIAEGEEGEEGEDASSAEDSLLDLISDAGGEGAAWDKMKDPTYGKKN